MALTFALLTSGQSVANGTAFTTASITVPAGALCVVFVNSQGVNTTDRQVPTGITGTGYPLNLVDSQQDAGFVTTSAWRARQTTAFTGTLTVSYTLVQDNTQWAVYAVIGDIDTSGTNGSGAIGSVVKNLGTATTLTQSLPFGGANNGAIAGFGWSSTSLSTGATATPNAGWIEGSDLASLESGYSSALQTQFLSSNGNPGVTWSAAPAGSSVTLVAFEIRDITSPAVDQFTASDDGVLVGHLALQYVYAASVASEINGIRNNANGIADPQLYSDTNSEQEIASYLYLQNAYAAAIADSWYELKDAAASINFAGSAFDAQDLFSGTFSSLVTNAGSVADSQDAFSGSFSAAPSISGDVVDGIDTFGGSFSALVSSQASITDDQDAVGGTFGAVAANVGQIVDGQDLFSGSFGVAAVLVNFSGAIQDAQDSVAGVFGPLANVAANLVDGQDVFSGAFAALPGFGGNLPDAQDSFAGQLSALQSIFGSVQDRQDVFGGTLSVLTGVGGNVVDAQDAFSGSFGVLGVAVGISGNVVDGQDAFSGSFGVVQSSQANDGDGGNAGGSAIKYKLLKAYEDEQERKKAAKRLKEISDKERKALKSAAKFLASSPEFSYQDVEDQVRSSLESIGYAPKEIHLDWLVYYMRILAFQLEMNQTNEEEELLVAMML